MCCVMLDFIANRHFSNILGVVYHHLRCKASPQLYDEDQARKGTGH